MAKSILGWVRDRWTTVLEPVLRTATVAQEEQLRALWEQELAWWKAERHLEGDSLRNPLTNVRTLIGQIPLTDDNQWFNPKTQKAEHIGTRVFNLAEGEWVSLNDRQREKTQERLDQQVVFHDPEAVVQRALPLLLSDEWAELVVGIALCTGRRLAEILLSGTFTLSQGYTVWFEGQLKASNRPKERFEIPTLLRSFLVVDAVQKVRRLVDCSELEVDQVSQKYSKAVNEVVVRVYGDLLPVRSTRESLTVHALRSVYAHIALLWFAPVPVSDVNYMAQIQGHRFILEPQVEPDTSEEEVERVRLNYSSHANYADYCIVDKDGQLDKRQGIKLEQPGVTVLHIYEQQWKQWLESRGESAPRPAAPVSKRKKKPAAENRTGYSSMKPLVATKDWIDELRERTRLQLRRSAEIKDDELLRRMAAVYALSLAPADQQEQPALALKLSLETLDIPDELRTLLQEGMALAGSPDLLSFLLAAGQREARQLRSQAKSQDTQRYALMPTSQLAKFKTPEAGQERFRRGVYSVMQSNLAMEKQERRNDLWYITPLLIQKLVGGRKDAISAYLDAHREEIDAHHEQLHIQRAFNRKAQPPDEVITIPEDPAAYPWGRPPAEVPAEVAETTETGVAS